MSYPKFPNAKGPTEYLDYEFKYADLLDGDKIDTSSFDIESGSVKIEEESVSPDKQIATVWISGGAEGETALIANRITTVGGRSWTRRAALKIKSQ